MRTYLSLVLLLIFTVRAQAQVQRGDHLITLNQPIAFTENSQLLNSWDLGEAYYNFSDPYLYLAIGPTYGYALTDRLVLGATGIFNLSAYEDRRDGAIGLAPYVRYYPLRKSNLGLYVQASSPAGFIYDWKGRSGISNTGFTGFEVANLRAGLQLPVASGVRLGPLLNYRIEAGRNTLTLGAQIEVVLRKDGNDEAGPAANFGAGSVMLGGQLAELGFRKNSAFGSLAVGGYYFLFDRLAAGLSIGAFGSHFGGLSVVKGLSFTTEVGARYYLTTAKRVVWYVAAGGGLQSGRQWRDDQFAEPTYRATRYAVTASAGGQYFLRDNLALEFGPNWRKVLEDEVTGDYIGFTSGVRFFLR